MKTQRLAIALTIINLALTVFLLAQLRRADAEELETSQQAAPVLRGRDFGQELLGQWPRGAQVFLRLRVDNRGFVSECILDRGTGVRSIDSEICNLAHQRLRFRPALNRSGQPVAGWFGYRQTPPR